MSGHRLRTTFRPLAHFTRSLLGTHGLSEQCQATAAKVDGLAARLDAYRAQVDRRLDEQQAQIGERSEEQGAVLNKMASAFALTREGLTYGELTGEPPAVKAPAVHGGGSRLCRQGDYATDAFRYWIGRIGWPPAMHRKLWEWFFVADALWSRGALRSGSRGLGFGVGTEPLTALFAAHDCEIIATDLDPESTRATHIGWTQTNQHASEIAALQYPSVCPPEKLRRLVTFRPVDMNQIPADLTGFDFTWSACSLEHLGSLRHGIDFVVRSMECLRPGGIAVHTTEFNLSSDSGTFESPTLSLYRRRDMEAMIAALEVRGHRVEPMDWQRGTGKADRYVDLPPYNAEVHLRLRLETFDCTSVGIIVHAKD